MGAHVIDRLISLDGPAECDRAVLEQRGCVVGGEWVDGHDALRGEPEQLPARHEHGQSIRAPDEPRDDVAETRQQVLGVVEQDESSTALESRCQGALDIDAFLLADAEGSGKRRGCLGGLVEGCERDPPQAVQEIGGRPRCCLDGQAGLADATRTDERHETDRRVRDQRDEILELGRPTDEWRRRQRQVRRREAHERPEVTGAELVDALWLDQVLQAMLAEVDQGDIAGLGKGDGLGGDEDLAAVSDRCDARRPMDVDADIALVGAERSAGVDTHPNADRSTLERGPRRVGRRQAVGRIGEGEEEGVSLGVDLDAAELLERRADRLGGARRGPRHSRPHRGHAAAWSIPRHR